MRISAFEAYGFPQKLIELWQSESRTDLLPIQIAAIHANVLRGQSVLLSGPPSCGKTFIGEVAAVQAGLNCDRVFYLVPQKALAEEIYRRFCARYNPFAVTTVISTRDHEEFDDQIRTGDFHIAVVVFEKMQSLIVSCPALLTKIRLVVVDELQMMADKSRGADLEVLLTQIKNTAPGAQFIGLSAVLGNCDKLAAWLNAKLCRVEERPVELRKGVVYGTRFEYVEHNSKIEGVEQLPQIEVLGNTLAARTTPYVRTFAVRGELNMVFCKSRSETVSTAWAISEALPVAPAAGALEELNTFEDSEGKEVLGALLQKGVAYHNSDLDQRLRELVENAFRRGEIKVLCSTSTLAVGVNLPAHNVFVDPECWQSDRFTRRLFISKITQATYENTVGRAGRYGMVNTFGRAIIVARSESIAKSFLKTYAKGKLDDIVPALDQKALEEHVLSLVASGICKTPENLSTLLVSSYTGERRWSGESLPAFESDLHTALQCCLDGQLIEFQNGRLAPTALGRLTAIKGIKVATAVYLNAFALKLRRCASSIQPFEVLLLLARSADGENTYLQLSQAEYDSDTYIRRARQLIRELPEESQRRLGEAFRSNYFTWDQVRRLKKAMLLNGWATGKRTRALEKNYNCLSGAIAHLAFEFSWLAEAFAEIVNLNGWPKATVHAMRKLASQIQFGVPATGVDVAQLRIAPLGRETIVKLALAGITSLKDAMQAPRIIATKLLSETLAVALAQAAEVEMDRQTERRGDVPAAELENEEITLPTANVPEWTEKVPPSDSTGGAYQTTLLIHLDGREHKRKHLVKFGDKEIWLGESSFLAMLKLAVGAKTAINGWVQLGSGGNHYQTLRRLKEELAAAGLPDGIDPEQLIENNRSKRYRLSVPPIQISLDCESIQSIPDAPEILAALNTAQP